MTTPNQIKVSREALLVILAYVNQTKPPYPPATLDAFGQLCRDLQAAGISPQDIYAAIEPLQTAVQP